MFRDEETHLHPGIRQQADHGLVGRYPLARLEEDLLDARGSRSDWRELVHPDLDFLPATGRLHRLRARSADLGAAGIGDLASGCDTRIGCLERRPRRIHVLAGDGRRIVAPDGEQAFQVAARAFAIGGRSSDFGIGLPGIGFRRGDLRSGC